MAETARAATELRRIGNRVRIVVRADFLSEAAIPGDIALWPEKTASGGGPVLPENDRFWDFVFDTPEEAQDFLLESEKKIAEAKAKLEWVETTRR